MPVLMTSLTVIILILSKFTLAAEVVERVELNLLQSQALAHQKENYIKILTDAVRTKQFTGIEILVADQLEKPSSAFGHAFIRLTDNDTDALNDLTISFEMQTIDPAKEYDRALNGGWENSIVVYNFAEAIIKYGQSEGRDLSRYIIPSTPAMRKVFIEYIKSIIWVPDLVQDYNFIENNCFNALLKVLSSSGLFIDHSLYKIPLLTSGVLRHNFLLLYPSLKIKTAGEIIDSVMSEYKKYHNQKVGCKSVFDLICGLKNDSLVFLKDQYFWNLIAKRSPAEIQKLYLFWPEKWRKHTVDITLLFAKNVKTRISTTQLLNIELTPFILYQKCGLKDDDCRMDRWRQALTVWSREEIFSIVKDYPSFYNKEVARSEQLIRSAREQMSKKLHSATVMDNVKSAYLFWYNFRQEP